MLQPEILTARRIQEGVTEKVELGRRMGNKYEVISGVNSGDQVVISGQSRLNNGMEVEIEK